jgi:hypothetical protein
VRLHLARLPLVQLDSEQRPKNPLRKNQIQMNPDPPYPTRRNRNQRSPIQHHLRQTSPILRNLSSRSLTIPSLIHRSPRNQIPMWYSLNWAAMAPANSRFQRPVCLALEPRRPAATSCRVHLPSPWSPSC